MKKLKDMDNEELLARRRRLRKVVAVFTTVGLTLSVILIVVCLSAAVVTVSTPFQVPLLNAASHVAPYAAGINLFISILGMNILHGIEDKIRDAIEKPQPISKIEVQ